MVEEVDVLKEASGKGRYNTNAYCLVYVNESCQTTEMCEIDGLDLIAPSLRVIISISFHY